MEIIDLIQFGNKFKCINHFQVQTCIFIAYSHSFFANFNFELDLISENTGITAESNLIPGLGHQFQVDTSQSNLKLTCQNQFESFIWAFRLLALYKTTMTQAYTRIRILGDETVNSALQSKLDREKNWHSKNSITDYAEKMFQQATLENYGQAEMSEWNDQASKHQCYKKNENNCQ